MRDLSKKDEKLRIENLFRHIGQLSLTLHPIEKQKSNKVNKITPVVRSLQLELNEKPLPESYHNWPLGRWFNRKIRVNNIPASAAACWSVAIRSLVPIVQVTEIYFQDESNGYGFITFDDHNYAHRFIEKFSNIQIPGADMVYQLSWAPFYLNPYLCSLEKGEETKQSDPLVSIADKVIESYPKSASMLHEMLAFHRSFRKEIVHISNVYRDRLAFEKRGVAEGLDNGRTAILCLTMVDPCVDESAVKLIFGEYGKCTVYVPNKEGYGIVKFDDRDCAEQAFVDLGNLLKDGNVCCLRWGVDRKELKKTKGENYWQRKAIVDTEASKRPRSAGSSEAKRHRKKY